MVLDFFSLFTIFSSPSQSMWILLIFCVLCYIIWVPWQAYKEKRQDRKKRPAKPKASDERTGPPPSDSRQRLKELKQLWKAGLYTDEEYRQKRKKIQRGR